MKAADLFCGAGGTSAGAEASGEVNLVFALNHWDTAIKTHAANFPKAKHVNSRLDMTHPSECPKIDLLFASPECTHHSNARGGRPMEDQKRAGAWDVAKWVEFHRPAWVVVENVREFRDWGPLHNGRPMKSGKGKTFDAWLMALRSLGYQVDHQLLNAADYGAATSRTRLFVVARKGKRSPIFPDPTHAKNPKSDLFQRKPQPWRAAAEVIDWSIPCPSIFSRKRPLADKTLRRIEMGLRKFVGPFVGQFMGPGMGDSSYTGLFDPSRPLPTILARNNHGVVIPYQVRLRNHGDAASPAEPLSTITGGGTHHGMAVPYIVPNFGEREGQAPRTHDVQNGMPAVTSHGAGGLAVPYLLQRQGFYDCQRDKMPKDIEGPFPVTTANHKPGHLVVPFIAGCGGRAGQSPPVDAGSPMRTMTSKADTGLIMPYIADVNHGDDGRTGDRVYSAADPLGSATTKRGKSLIVPFLTSYYGNAQFQDVGSPVQTITTKDRHCIVCPELAPHVPDWRAIQEWESEGGSTGAPFSEAMISLLETMRELGVIDIGFRMFENHELALAQGFQPGYQFHGTKADITKQIGNSVSPSVAKAISLALAGA